MDPARFAWLALIGLRAPVRGSMVASVSSISVPPCHGETERRKTIRAPSQTAGNFRISAMEEETWNRVAVSVAEIPQRVVKTKQMGARPEVRSGWDCRPSPILWRTAGSRRFRPFAGLSSNRSGRRLAVIRAALIVLVDNNVVGPAIHGVIALGVRSEEVRKWAPCLAAR